MEVLETVAIQPDGGRPAGTVRLAAMKADIPGDRFSKCLEQSKLGEIWEVAGPDGEPRRAYVLPSGEDAETAVSFLHSFTHSGLPAVQILSRNGRPVLVVAPEVITLRERFRECWAKGLPGVPKRELLGYLRSAASTLDDLLQRQRVQHLDLRPENLLIHNHHVYVAGYGLMHFLWLPVREQTPLPNPKYAAPELFQPHISSRCDQYSLALIYAEMITGTHPFRTGRDTRKGQHARPDLGLLADAERAIVAQALSPSPSSRFASSSEFIAALEAAGQESDTSQGELLLSNVLDLGSRKAFTPFHCLDYFVSELLLSLGSPCLFREFNSVRYKLEPGQLLEHHCAVRMFPGAALLKLAGFRENWDAQQVHQEDGLLVFRVSLPPTFWQKLTGKRMGLEIQIQLVPAMFAGARQSEIVVLIRPYGCDGKQAVQLLADLGPKILDSLRGYLQAQPEQRNAERLPCNEVVRVLPVISGIEISTPIECVTKDVSSNGIGFFLSKMLPSSQVYINLPGIPELSEFAGLAQIVRSQPCGEGWFEVGARFARDKLKSGR